MKARVISALVAAFILIAIFFIWHSAGLFAICTFCTIMCMLEFSRLTLSRLEAPIHLRVMFIALNLFMLATVVEYEHLALEVFCALTVVFFVMALMNVKSSDTLNQAYNTQAAGIIGFTYVGIFPGMALRLLAFERGDVWLLGLLALVFAGDTTAYLVGRKLGKTKLLASVSPMKSVEGAIGGLLGSALVGCALGIFFFHELSLFSLIALSIVTGIFAQAGDLFESLLKRIADVKDSGRIMPGHGGMLDRLDGVIFSAPIYYLLVYLLVR